MHSSVIRTLTEVRTINVLLEFQYVINGIIRVSSNFSEKVIN